MPGCSIFNCPNTSKKGGAVKQCISYHCFPKDPSLKNKWIEATGRKKWYSTKNSRICSAHFDEYTFSGLSKYRRLMNTAYPTIDIVIVSTNEEDVLKKMRILDDKIVYALNTSLPTESFQSKVNTTNACEDLFKQIQQGHQEREKVIKNCIVATVEILTTLKTCKEQNPNDVEALKNFKAEQRKLRILQTELSVEEVIKDKTTKLFSEKCRTFYKPQSL